VFERRRCREFPEKVAEVELPPDRVAVVGSGMGRTGGDDEGVVVVAGVWRQVIQVGNRVRWTNALGKWCVAMKVPQAQLLWAAEGASQGVLRVDALPVHSSVPSGLVIRSLTQVLAPKG